MSPSSLDVGGLGGEPDDVGGHECHSGAHDDEERVQPGVRLQRLPRRALQKKLGSFVFPPLTWKNLLKLHKLF